MQHAVYFICYSRADSEFALKLNKDLKARGVDTFLDQINLKLGPSWDDQIEIALRSASSVLFLASPASVNSENVKDELDFALSLKKNIIPVMIEACQFPLRYRRKNYIDLSSNYREGLSRLIENLQNNAEVNSDSDAKSPVAEVKSLSSIKAFLFTGIIVFVILSVIGFAVFIYKNDNIQVKPVSDSSKITPALNTEDTSIRDKNQVQKPDTKNVKSPTYLTKAIFISYTLKKSYKDSVTGVFVRVMNEGEEKLFAQIEDGDRDNSTKTTYKPFSTNPLNLILTSNHILKDSCKRFHVNVWQNSPRRSDDWNFDAKVILKFSDGSEMNAWGRNILLKGINDTGKFSAY